MTFNIAVKQEQQQRIEADLVAVEAQIDKDTDLYYDGRFDGATGGKPEQDLWSNLNYRNGYLAGIGEYYDKKFKTTFKEVF